MFEKEAEEYLRKDGTKAEQLLIILNEISPLKITTKQLPFVIAMSKQIFQDGAEFGYNKANEWHYNEIPHDNKPYLCKVEQPTKYDESEYEILFFDDKDMSWFRWLTLWSGEEGNETARINRKVIAWKEIVLPKECE